MEDVRNLEIPVWGAIPSPILRDPPLGERLEPIARSRLMPFCGSNGARIDAKRQQSHARVIDSQPHPLPQYGSLFPPCQLLQAGTCSARRPAGSEPARHTGQGAGKYRSTLTRAKRLTSVQQPVNWRCC